MDIGAIGINAIDTSTSARSISARSTSARSTPPQSTSSPMGPRARSMSPAYRERCRLEGRCVRCGAHDHWVEDCLLEPFKKQISMTALCDYNQALQK
ncbi:hypothetical protein V2W45_1358749 [Cenococcum geophilum]